MEGAEAQLVETGRTHGVEGPQHCRVDDATDDLVGIHEGIVHHGCHREHLGEVTQSVAVDRAVGEQLGRIGDPAQRDRTVPLQTMGDRVQQRICRLEDRDSSSRWKRLRSLDHPEHAPTVVAHTGGHEFLVECSMQVDGDGPAIHADGVVAEMIAGVGDPTGGGEQRDGVGQSIGPQEQVDIGDGPQAGVVVDREQQRCTLEHDRLDTGLGEQVHDRVDGGQVDEVLERGVTSGGFQLRQARVVRRERGESAGQQAEESLLVVGGVVEVEHLLGLVPCRPSDGVVTMEDGAQQQVVAGLGPAVPTESAPRRHRFSLPRSLRRDHVDHEDERLVRADATTHERAAALRGGPEFRSGPIVLVPTLKSGSVIGRHDS